MINDKIEDDTDAAFFGFVDEIVKIGKGAVHRIDVFVIRDVVTEIDLWRGETGSDPDGIDAELLQVNQVWR